MQGINRIVISRYRRAIRTVSTADGMDIIARYVLIKITHDIVHGRVMYTNNDLIGVLQLIHIRHELVRHRIKGR